MNPTLSQRAQKLTSSVIREILKITERPEVISFAGGLPSPDTFPVERVLAATQTILTTAPTPALQYGPTEGYLQLREWIAARHSTGSVRIDPADVLVTTGSQQALDLLGKTLIDSGSRVLVETPTYLGALQAFSLSEPTYVSVPSDEHGPQLEMLTREDLSGARFMYCLPNFQNPTGRRIPLARREQLAKIAVEAGLLVVEDDPYGALSYSGDALPTLKSMMPENVVYLGSFSKVLTPGLRVGYLIAPQALHRKLVQAKQAADLHTPSFTQRIVYECVKDGFLDTHIPTIRELYRQRCQVMLEAMQEHFPNGVSWNRPEGGMFIWVNLPTGMDSVELLQKAIAENVAFVPGAPFFANEPQRNTLRLSFVTVPPERIQRGIAALGALIERESVGLKV
ncbi:aminotransferase-like domain-containing protein [Steroidobacter agaridevorans]|uniref:aminotransferase-like domain-containing protein n=1 Tax=Steroidobacter agaridevorans TaxID=2695856 RepID=UPI0013249EFA|nr:PLP-dependent aminotransferase family protein [Steroidobacter agaridevorans]GFE86473.1 2-aminoadipate aminotransferase [Steroidobacter agaridevorans]